MRGIVHIITIQEGKISGRICLPRKIINTSLYMVIYMLTVMKWHQQNIAYFIQHIEQT